MKGYSMRHAARLSRTSRFFAAGTAALAIPLAVSLSGVALGQAKADGGAVEIAPNATTPASGPDAAVSSASAIDAGASSASASAAEAGAPVVAPPAVSSPDSGMDGATYTVRLRDLEARVDELKDQIRRSHNRLSMLSDTILSGGLAGSRAEIEFANEMSSAFRLIKGIFIVDGAPQYSRSDETGTLADQKQIPVYSGSVPPGDHTIQALLTFQGNGYGVFTYLRGYKFEVKSTHSFTAVEGKTLTLTAVAYEQGGVTTALQDRPKVEWREKVQPIAVGAAAAQPAAPAGAPEQGGGGGK
jgi:hypothetical protein